MDHDPIRAAHLDDLPALGAIYAHWARTSEVTFDVEPREGAVLRGWFDAHTPRGPHRLLVFDDGGVRGYATSSRHRDRPAYATSVEVSVYLAESARGHRVGSRLLARLLEELATEPVHRAYAGIALPNPASVQLVTSAGFHRIGVFSEVGFKLGRYIDVAWYERAVGA